MDEVARPLITFVAVAFRRYRLLPVLVSSLIAQTDKRWHLWILHDGPDELHRELGKDLKALSPGRIAYAQTDERLGRYGHPLRAAGLELATTEWVVLTNDDNYYAPTYVEEVLRRAETNPAAAVIACNMIHSHVRQDYAGAEPPKRYGLLEVKPRKCFCDVGAFAARTELARVVGFKGTEHDSDGDYLEAVLAEGRNRGMGWSKIRQVLFVHN